MYEEALKKAVTEFAQEGESKYEKTFSVKGVHEEVFTVKIERKKDRLISESLSMESRSNMISALPPGAPCEFCGGSGRSS